MVLRLPMPRLAPLRDMRVSSSGWARRVATVLAAFGAVGVGTAAGLLLTAAAIRSDAIGTLRVGAWRLALDAGTPSVNPYVRARAARLGNIPLAAAQGLTATARYDDAGQALDGRCRYRLSGPVPAAQFWTLEAADLKGHPFDNAAERHGFTATDVLRGADGRFTIAMSPDASPGNWLPLPGAGRFMLVLRLYDTGLTSGGAAAARSAAWPTIEPLGCP